MRVLFKDHWCNIPAGAVRHVQDSCGRKLVGEKTAVIYDPYNPDGAEQLTDKIRKQYNASLKSLEKKKPTPKPEKEAPAKTEKAGDLVENK